MSKIEREIEVLRILKHPNIVRLYDVIETDKYIGIILEYASGGELFDHILAHRYLRERDAAKLFSQLISGVWYIHQKKIVHRDLKLENLLLDRNRNVIITDFGFANRFEHRADDLMQTSCGSPCYAAPELVISEGLYVGSAVDIWSCGVILYAMLAGYLPFDDDPANPDGDNINLLYKYIVSTPLSFPDYISAEARDLLSIMLVPDPSRRASLELVMKHPWLGAYTVPDDGSDVLKAFGKSVDDLERAAMEQHQQKRLAYQKQMKTLAVQSVAAASPDPRANRSLSYRPAEPVSTNVGAGRSKSSQPAQSEYIYQSSAADQSIVSVAHATPNRTDTTHRTYGSPSAPIGVGDDDPFAGPGGKPTGKGKAPEATGSTLSVQPQQGKGQPQKAPASTGEPSSFRHTIQVEYDAPAPSSKQGRKNEDKERKTGQGQTNGMPSRIPQPTNRAGESVPQKPTKERRASSTKPLPLPPSSGAPSSFHATTIQKSPGSMNVTLTKRGNAAADTTPQAAAKIPIVNVASPPDTPAKVTSREASDESASQNSISSKRGHKKGGASLDKIGLAKIFGGGSYANGEASPHTERMPSESSNGASGRAPSRGSSVLLSPNGSEKEKEKEKGGGRKNRRNTLTVMVEPIISRTMRSKTAKGRAAMTPVTTEPPNTAMSPNDSAVSVKLKADKEKEREKAKSAGTPQNEVIDSPFVPDLGPGIERGVAGLQASTNKARKVMQWFRTKSKGARDSIITDPLDDEKTQAVASPTIEVASPVQVFVTTTPTAFIPRTPIKSQRTASTATGSILSTPSLVKRFRNSVTVATGTPSASASGSKPGVMQIHRGAVDQTMVTTRPPAEVMKHVREVLEGMGLEIQAETEYMFKCVRAKRKKGVIGGGMGSVAVGQGVVPAGPGGGGSSGSLAAVTMVGSAASNGVSGFVAYSLECVGDSRMTMTG
ncbi:hypothetical protein AX15_002747 [Amanita polypyramis BW_CC]|nr:hypothetical protein AX15_002747 [Amanita polypyramis BW_CC]